jgi:polysaccharide biosynthesis/export protein
MRQFSSIRAFRFTLVLLVMVACATIQSGWSQNAATSPASIPAPMPLPPIQGSKPADLVKPALLIGGGDLLKVSILGAPESDQDVRVNEDGEISLSFVGNVHVAGLTTTGAQELIRKKLIAGGFFTDPQVSVFSKEYATQGVSVLGEVAKPGVYPLLGSRRLFDVISLAGGTTQQAGKVVSITHRDHPEAPTSVMLSNDAGESAKSNIEVFTGDTILVSRAGVVYVVGDVHRPSGVVMNNGSEMTVLQAIAMAEGTNPTAALSKAKLIRRTPSGPKETPMNLKDMLASRAPDIRLQAEDIIFVPNSAAKSATGRTLEAIVQTATGLVIYGLR